MTKIVKLFLSVCALTFALASCDTANSPADSTKNPGTSGGTTGTVSGTVTIPASMANRQWVVLIDTDMNGGNGFTAMVNGSVTGTTFSYTLSNVAPGSYYVYAIVYAVGDGTAAPVNGDYYGIYNATGQGSPATANVTVTAGTTATCNFSVFAFSNVGGGDGDDEDPEDNTSDLVQLGSIQCSFSNAPSRTFQFTSQMLNNNNIGDSISPSSENDPTTLYRTFRFESSSLSLTDNPKCHVYVSDDNGEFFVTCKITDSDGDLTYFIPNDYITVDELPTTSGTSLIVTCTPNTASGTPDSFESSYPDDIFLTSLVLNIPFESFSID